MLNEPRLYRGIEPLRKHGPRIDHTYTHEAREPDEGDLLVHTNEEYRPPPVSILYTTVSKILSGKRGASSVFRDNITSRRQPQDLQGIMVFPGVEEDDFRTKAGSILNYA